MLTRVVGRVCIHQGGGFIGFNVSAVPDPVADAKLAADAETMLSWGMDSLKVDGCTLRLQISTSKHVCFYFFFVLVLC